MKHHGGRGVRGVHGGREHKGGASSAGCMLCNRTRSPVLSAGRQALMLGFSYLAPGEVNEVVALFLRK